MNIVNYVNVFSYSDFVMVIFSTSAIPINYVCYDYIYKYINILIVRLIGLVVSMSDY